MTLKKFAVTSAPLICSGARPCSPLRLNDSRREIAMCSKERVVALPIDIIGKRNGNLRLVRVGLGDDHDPIRFRIGQRLEQDRVDHAENRGVRADPERERENGDEGEAGRLQQLPDGISDLLKWNDNANG